MKYIIDIAKTLEWDSKEINLGGFITRFRFANNLTLFSENMQASTMFLSSNKNMLKLKVMTGVSRSSLANIIVGLEK